MTGEPTPSIRGFDPTIVEMVRVEANRRRLGDDDGSLARRFGEETERIADAVEVALRWIDAGLLSEAVAYSVDAGNLVKRGLAIEALLASLAEGTAGRTWLGRIPPHRGLDRRAIERLNVAHADVASAEALLAAHRASALEVASPLERMATLDRLRAKLPRNAALAEESEDLEHAIERGLRANLARADRLGDAVEIEQIRAVLASRGWATRIPENLGAEVEAVRRRLVERANSEERQALAARIHAAFAEMDRTALEELETRWNRLGGGDLPDPAIDSAFRWLESQRSADAADLEAARLVVDLERVLDAGLGLEEAEPIASSLARLDRTPPPRIFARLEALRQRDLEERKRRRRRRLLLVGGTALLLIAGTAWVSLRLLEQQAALASAEAADSFARQGEFERAAELIEGLVASNRGDDVLLPSARDRYDALIAAATIAIEVDARALSDAQSILAEVDEIAGSVDDSSPLAEQRLAVESALRRLATIEGDRLDATRTARKSELESRLESIDRRLAGSMRETVAELDREAASTPSPSPAASQAALRDALRSIDDLVADARERFAAISAGRGDGDATEAFLDRLAARREAIVVRIAALDAMDLLLAELAAETDDESRFLAAYEKLLSDHGAVLAARGVLEAHERGLEAARSGAAIRHWREIASRSIRAASGDGGWHPEARGDARAVVAAIADHLARFPESPHREAAARHRTYVARLADLPGDAESLRDATIDRLYDSGYGSLFRTPLSNGGFVYRRAGGNGAFDFSITNESELAAPPNRLLPRAGVPAQPSGQTIETMPSRLLGEWMPRLETADPQSIRSTLLGLIDSAARAKEDDPMLQLAFLRMLWRTYAAMPGPSESAPTNWLDDLAASRIGPRGIDFLERSCDGRQALADPRRLALLAIAEAPDARRLAETEDRWWRQSIEGLAPAAASGTLVPVGPDGPLRLNRGGGEWTLVAGRDGVVLVRTAFEGGIASFAGVAAPPAPAQCFER